MILVKLSVYSFAILSCLLVFGLAKYHNRYLARWFVILVLSIAVYYVLNSEYEGALVLKSCTPIDRFLKRCCSLMVGISALAGLQIAMIMAPLAKHQDKVRIAAWISLVIYIVAIFIINDNYIVDASYLLPSILLLMFAFIRAYFNTLEKEISYGAMGSILLFIGMFFEKLSLCIHPVSCECDFCYVILNGMAIALIAKAIHHIIDKESKTTIRKPRCKRPAQMKLGYM